MNANGISSPAAEDNAANRSAELILHSFWTKALSLNGDAKLTKSRSKEPNRRQELVSSLLAVNLPPPQCNADKAHSH
jgi:hypothetical protein